MASDSSAAPTNPVDIEESEKCTASPNCAAKCPFVYNYGPVHMRGLEPGKLYSFCTCGLSKQQPWCDQSHRGTNFRPLQWRCPPDHRQSIYAMCGCKYSQSLPFCDGSRMCRNSIILLTIPIIIIIIIIIKQILIYP